MRTLFRLTVASCAVALFRNYFYNCYITFQALTSKTTTARVPQDLLQDDSCWSVASSKDGSSRPSSIGSAIKKTAQTAADTLTGKAKKKKSKTKRTENVASMPPPPSAMQHSRVHEDRGTKPSTVTLDDISEGTHANKDVTVDDGSPIANSSNLSKESSTQGDTQGGASWLSVESQLRNELKATEANLK